MEFSYTTGEHKKCLHALTEEINEEDEGGSLAAVDKVLERFWSELHSDLLEPIAHHLGIIELLGFRGTCKGWRSASFNASAEIQSKAYQAPWLLQYGDNFQCLLSDISQDRHYSINLPELEGGTCIASDGGWLLVYIGGSIFFFCPFSRAKIDLPPLPDSEASDHVAVISSSPTYQDCIVCVIHHLNSTTLVLNSIQCGATEWTTHEYHDRQERLKTITCALHYDGVFYFMDPKDALLTFSLEKIKWAPYKIVDGEGSNCRMKTPFAIEKNYFSTRIMERNLGLTEHFTISICGTKIKGNDYDYQIHNENVCQFDNKRVHHHKGVWIHPRLHHLPPSYSWCP